MNTVPAAPAPPAEPAPGGFPDMTDFRKVMQELEIAEPRVTALPHLWKWDHVREQLTKSENFDLTEVHRRAFALCNPGLGGHPNATSTLFASVSIYYPGDRAPVHRHTPSASRFALEGTTGYTNVAGELLRMNRGDLVITPNGEWHDHGNDGDEPVIWVDVLDAPLIEKLNAIMTEWDYAEPPAGSNSAEPIRTAAQSVTRPASYSDKLFAANGIAPRTGGRNRIGRAFTPKYVYRAADARAAQEALKEEGPDPVEGVLVEYVDPTTGNPVVPTMSFRSQLLPPGFATWPKRTPASTVYTVLEGEGRTRVGDKVFEWSRNDIFVIPGWFWFEHENTGNGDAVLYNVTDAPALQKLNVYRAQARSPEGGIVDLSAWPSFR